LASPPPRRRRWSRHPLTPPRPGGLPASIVGTGEGWLTELSTAQLRELFTLEDGSVVE
jgi:hypothetical protein